MIGISEDIAKRYSEADLQRLFGQMAHHGEVRVRYARPNGDLTSPMPSSRHMSYVAKGWTAVEIVTEPVAVQGPAIVISPAIAAHANHDRVGVWTRGADQLESSCRNALSLLSAGFKFAGLADVDRLRAAAEARPFPKAAAAAQPAEYKVAESGNVVVAPEPIETAKRK